MDPNSLSLSPRWQFLKYVPPSASPPRRRSRSRSGKKMVSGSTFTTQSKLWYWPTLRIMSHACMKTSALKKLAFWLGMAGEPALATPFGSTMVSMGTGGPGLNHVFTSLNTFHELHAKMLAPFSSWLRSNETSVWSVLMTEKHRSLIVETSCGIVVRVVVLVDSFPRRLSTRASSVSSFSSSSMYSSTSSSTSSSSTPASDAFTPSSTIEPL
mmetsp:Transcript_89639/g.254114  ORF Transcript_89639/g.254114 Transcript_89639/m.254114 type:complete len:212 (-) Transcript_89639:683-1318(-)